MWLLLELFLHHVVWNADVTFLYQKDEVQSLGMAEGELGGSCMLKDFTQHMRCEPHISGLLCEHTINKLVSLLAYCYS